MIITDITNIGDPQILCYKGRYYCYATSFVDGFCVWTSDDLENWSEKKLCFKAIDYWGKSHFWAPEVVFHNGKFVMHYTAMSRALDSLRIGVAVSDSPEGPFIDVHGKPMFDPGYAAIDGSVLKCDEGNFLYYSRECSENRVNGIPTSEIYCVRLNDDLTKTVGEHILVSTPTEPLATKHAMHSSSHFSEVPALSLERSTAQTKETSISAAPTYWPGVMLSPKSTRPDSAGMIIEQEQITPV